MIPRIAVVACVAVSLAGCVQKTYDRTVIYELDVSAADSITSIGARGSDKPLSWDEDLALTPVVKDSLYRLVVTYRTGCLVTETKFAVNGKLELHDKPNRRIEFTGGDTTIYRARFNQTP